jgi:hypothetical protein
MFGVGTTTLEKKRVQRFSCVGLFGTDSPVAPRASSSGFASDNVRTCR